MLGIRRRSRESAKGERSERSRLSEQKVKRDSKIRQESNVDGKNGSASTTSCLFYHQHSADTSPSPTITTDRDTRKQFGNKTHANDNQDEVGAEFLCLCHHHHHGHSRLLLIYRHRQQQ